MSTPIFRIAHSKTGLFVYPTPVDKTHLYLIQAPELFHAKIYKHLLDHKVLASPKVRMDFYKLDRIHQDGVTQILNLCWDKMELRFLPHREVNPDKARILEDLLLKKIKRLLEQPSEASKIIGEIQFRYAQQRLCSECDKLGINDDKLISWVSEFSNLQNEI